MQNPPQNPRENPARGQRLAASEALREGSAIKFRILLEGREEEAFAVRVQGQVRAYVNVCTHRALPLDLGEGTFFTDDGSELLCRAHGARFDPMDGSCTGGICRKGSGLTPLTVRECEGFLHLDGTPLVASAP